MANAQDIAVYIDGEKLPINPSKISFKGSTDSNIHNILGIGEVEILHGDKLVEVEIEGFLP